MGGLTIGKVAAQAGMGVETIRFYERLGLIAEPARRSSGYRDYAPGAVQRLQFIRRAKELGFTLREIGELLSLRVDDERTCQEVYRLATAKIADVEDKIRQLQAIRSALANMAAACEGSGPKGECPILDALEHENGSILGA